MIKPPPIELLDQRVVIDRSRDTPLHAQLRRAMYAFIEEEFEHGQQFWTEQALIQKLDVSQITVRRALNDLVRDGVLLRRVAKGAIVLKEKPSQSDYRVNVVIPNYNSDTLSSLLENVASVCQERDRKMNVCYFPQGSEVTAIMRRLELGPEGERILLLANPPDSMNTLLDVLGERGYGVVAVETTMPHGRCAYAGIDDKAGVEVGLAHLMSLGHRRIAMLIGEPERMDSVILRRLAFERVMTDASLPVDVVSGGAKPWDNAYAVAYAAMSVLWDRPASEHPTAIFAVSDACAWAALKWLAERGVTVPGEVSVLGFNDDRLSRCTHPALTTLHWDGLQIARHALDLLDDTSSRAVRLVPPQLILRESVGVPMS